MAFGKLLIVILVGVIASSYQAVYAGDIISCDSFENCPDGSEPLTNALLDLQARIEALEAAAAEPEEDWNAVVFENGWTAYVSPAFGAPEYYKDKQGTVHLRGLIASGNCGQTMFTLPEGYRPPFQVLVAAPKNNGTARVDVRADGGVYSIQNCDPSWMSLWNISFRTY